MAWRHPIQFGENKMNKIATCSLAETFDIGLDTGTQVT